MAEIPTTPDGHIDYARIFEPGWKRDVGGERTDCGPGSLPRNTQNVQSALARIIADFGVESINDVGCGDLAWMAPFVQKIRQRQRLRYAGYDVVPRGTWAALNSYDLREQDCTRQPIEHADLTVVRDLTLHLENDAVRAVLQNAFAHSGLVFVTTFGSSETKERFTNDPNERAARFMTDRLNLVHAMIDLDVTPFNLISNETYTAAENYPGKYMKLYEAANQPPEFLHPSI